MCITTFVLQVVVFQQQIRFMNSFSVSIRSNSHMATIRPSIRTGSSSDRTCTGNTPPWRGRSDAYYQYSQSSATPICRMVARSAVQGGGKHYRNRYNNVSPVVVNMIGVAASSLVDKSGSGGVLRVPSSLCYGGRTRSTSTRRALPPLFLSKIIRAEGPDQQVKRMLQLKTLARISIPSIVAGIVATVAFPFLALTLATLMNDAGVFAVLSQDSSQFVQNFLTVAGLLFSILVGQTYYFMYIQQEAVYYSLFNEVTEAKSLLEQVALVCQGRR
jgi:hypothetical protein